MGDTSLFDPELAREFKKAPRGRHSPALQHLLSLMRLERNCLDLLIVETVPHAEWTLARGGKIGVRPQLLDRRFGSLAAAEYEVFRQRWLAMGASAEPCE
jgi:hypothetical protein